MSEPLASKIRPNSLDEIIGQQHLIGEGKPIRIATEQKHTYSHLFYGDLRVLEKLPFHAFMQSQLTQNALNFLLFRPVRMILERLLKHIMGCLKSQRYYS